MEAKAATNRVCFCIRSKGEFGLRLLLLFEDAGGAHGAASQKNGTLQ
jgi:hypothetical protein